MPPVRSEPERRSHSRRQKPGHVPRPKNAFMCYRSWCYANKPLPPVTDGKKPNQQAFSKQVAIDWNSMSPEEQAPYHDMAKQEKKQHELKYPLYSYSPGKSQPNAAAAGRKRSTRPRPKGDETPDGEESTCGEHGASPPPAEQRRRVRCASDASRASGTSDLRPFASLSPPPPSPTPSLCASSSASELDLVDARDQASDYAMRANRFYIDQSVITFPNEKNLGPFLASYDIERPAHMNDGPDMFGVMHRDWSVDEELFSPNLHEGTAPFHTYTFNHEPAPYFLPFGAPSSDLWLPDLPASFDGCSAQITEPTNSPADPYIAPGLDELPAPPAFWPPPSTPFPYEPLQTHLPCTLYKGSDLVEQGGAALGDEGGAIPWLRHFYLPIPDAASSLDSETSTIWK